MNWFIIFAFVTDALVFALDPAVEINREDAPFTVGIFQFVTYDNQEQNCSAVIIDKQHLLTAASCSALTEMWSYYEPHANDRATFARFWTHYLYDPFTSENNIAVIRLDDPINFTETLQVIGLPSQGELPDLVSVDIYSFRQGVDFDNNTLSLAEGQHIIECEDLPEGLNQSTVYCTSAAITEIGDNGGAVIQNNIVVGILSGTIHPDSGKGTVFTPVGPYVDWIKSIISY